MTEGKWTKGPWAIRRGHSVVEIRTTAGLEIAQTAGGHYWQNFTDEALANARLIAAAPELAEQGEQSAVTLDEAANILEGAGYSGVASICRAQSERQRAALSLAREVGK